MQIVKHSITFYLRNPQLSETALVVIIQWKKNQIRKGAGMSIATRFWEQEQQRVKPNATGAREVNLQIEYVKNKIHDVFKIYAAQNPASPSPPKEWINNALLLAMGKKTTDTSTLFGFIEQHITDRQKDNVTPERVYRLRQTFDLLKEFALATSKKIEFDTITAGMAKEFTNFLYKEKKMSPASVKLYFSIYRYFLKKAARAGHITNVERVIPDRTELIQLKTDTIRVYLTYSEIVKIASLDLSKRPMYDKVRDLFLIGCATGLRESDYTKVKAEAIQGNDLKVFMQKTKKYTRIPASQTVKDILKKYNNTLPDVSLVHLNKTVKAVCKMAGITEIVEHTKTGAGGLVVSVSKPKYMFVSSHTARRSYATNAYKTGVPINVISYILGHSNINTTEKYLHLTEEEKAAQAQNYGQLTDFTAGAQIESRQNMKVAK